MEPVVNIPPIYKLWSLPFDDGIFHFDNSLPPASDSLVDDNPRFEVISNVHGMEVSEVLARSIGIGKISCRICRKSGMPSKVRRIWLEWLGYVDVDSDKNEIPEHEISIATFSCNKQLGPESARGKGEKGEDKFCEICLQQIFPKKDAGVLIEVLTRRSKIFCRNERAFHIYHLSCLIQLILLCEAVDVEEVHKYDYGPPPPGTYYRLGDEDEQDVWTELPELPEDDGVCVLNTQPSVLNTHPLVRSLFCPQCDHLPNHAFASIGKCRETLSQAREEWLNTPEMLENCSMGLCFPLEDVEGRSRTKPYAPLVSCGILNSCCI